MTTELENGVEIPNELPARKQRARRAKKTEQSSAVASLISALKFVSPAQKKAGTSTQQHCAISGHWLCASNGVLTIGAKVEEDLTACPHTMQLLDALAKCGQELSIVQLSENMLSVKSEKFKALIPCASLNELELTAPDDNIAVIDNRVKEALASVACLATEGATNAVHASVLLQANTCVATNGFAILEHWHGLSLPPGMLIPKASAVAIVKTAKILTGFGYSGPSCTFWFEDGSFIKTQLYGERYPHCEQILNVKTNPWPLPDEFFKAVHAVETFSKSGIVYFDIGVVSSRESESEATTYSIEGLPEGMAFNAKYLTMLEHAFKKADFRKETSQVYFFGESVRGMLMGIDMNKTKEHTKHTTEFADDDIPF